MTSLSKCVIVAVVAGALGVGCAFTTTPGTVTKYTAAVGTGDFRIALTMPLQNSKAECQALQDKMVQQGKDFLKTPEGRGETLVYTDCVALKFKVIQ
jgi:hypothetical protein